MPRTIDQLLAQRLDRAAIPMDESGAQLFSEGNPGVISDPVTQAQLTGLATETHEILEETETIEHHIHNVERWLGIAAPQTSRNWAAEGVNNPFVVTSGNNDWGTIIQILGRGDTPVIPESVNWDMHRILIVDASVNTPYKIRFIFTGGGIQHALSVGQYTEQMFMIDAANPQQSGGFPVDILMPVICSGRMVYAQVWNATNLATAEFFIGLHEYPPVRCVI